MVIVSLSFSLSFKEGNIFGKLHEPRNVGKEHESGKIQNAHPEGLNNGETKRASKSS